MNVLLPEKEKMGKKRATIYIIAMVICILAIIIVVEIQILGNDIVNEQFGITKITKRSEQELVELKVNFEKIFDNQLDRVDDVSVKKIENENDIVYTVYQKQNTENNSEINVNLPYVNINNDEVRSFNKEVIDTFEAKTEELIKGKKENTIYTVKYKANIENNILSLIIYSDLKQGASAQRVIVQTLNYDLIEDKVISLEDIINKYNLKRSEVQANIREDVKLEQSKSDELKKLGYNVFSRNLDSDIYNIENVSEYFIYKNNIYIVFAYGNSQMTSEIDLVII